MSAVTLGPSLSSLSYQGPPPRTVATLHAAADISLDDLLAGGLASARPRAGSKAHVEALHWRESELERGGNKIRASSSYGSGAMSVQPRAGRMAGRFCCGAGSG